MAYNPFNRKKKRKVKMVDLERLKKWNWFCAGWHFFLNFVPTLILTIMVNRIGNFRLPLHSSYAHWEKNKAPETRLDEIAMIPFGAVTTTVSLLSALAHCYVATYGWKQYVDNIGNFRNPVRWMEYAISASLMFVLIALLFAIYDVSLLIALFSLNVIVMYTGHLMELFNTKTLLLKNTAEIFWQPFVVGCGISIVQWALLYSTMATAEWSKIPNFVYALIFSYFFLYMAFAVNLGWFYSRGEKNNREMDFYNCEVRFMWLSIVSKTLLVWLIFSGVMQGNE